MLSSLLGIWLVSFVLWLVNMLISEAILTKKPRLVLILISGLAGIAFVGIIWADGAGSENYVPVVLVQSSDQASRLAELSGHNPKALAIWPEFGGLSENQEWLLNLSKRENFPAFVTRFRDDYEPLPHNIAALFWRGTISELYAKRLLFGSEEQMHSAGSQAVVAKNWPTAKVGLTICFDACAPGIVRESAGSEVDLIALPTIDPPSPHYWIAAMHAAYTPFRAAESSIPIVRADGYAYSQAVDAYGNTHALLVPGERAQEVQVLLGRRWTLFSNCRKCFLGSLWFVSSLGFDPEQEEKPFQRGGN